MIDLEAPWTSGETLRLRFDGAAGDVTGSRFLLRTERARVLFECGLFQGGRATWAHNREPFGFDPGLLDAVVLTHAHLDHSGLVPRLVQEGLDAPVHATRGTAKLAEILLLDAAHIQEGEAERRTRRNLRRGRKPVEPLYGTNEAERALARFRPAPFGERVRVAPGVDVCFRPAGHILGAAHVEILVRSGDEERSLVLSGDVGRAGDPLLCDPDPPPTADLVLLESTYGDRDHRDRDATEDELAEILNASERSGGNVLIPVFAVGRAQEILHAIGKLERTNRIHPRRVYLDSPMAVDVTRLYRSREHGCRAEQDGAPAPITTRELVFTRDWQESMTINFQRGVIVLSASGMCDAGRILHHLKHQLWKPETHVVFTGFQAAGTRGRSIVEGARMVRVLGEEIAVKASVHTLGGFSAHAGQSELCAWYRRIDGRPPLVLVHGEATKRATLADAIARAAGVRAALPERGDVLILERGRREPRWERAATDVASG